MSPEIVKNRWLGFLIWQSITSTIIFLLYKTLILSLLLKTPSLSLLFSLFTFLSFHLSLLLFSLSLFITTSPQDDPPASISELSAGFLNFILKSIVLGTAGGSPELSAPAFRRRARTSVGFFIFAIVCGLSGFLSMVSVCGTSELFDGMRLISLGFRGFVFGLAYGIYYVYKKRWVLGFPIIQRPFFFSFKMGLPSSLKQALQISIPAFLCTTLLMIFLPDQFKSKGTVGQLIFQQIIFFLGTFIVSFSWELSHHLLQVVHTRRCIFAPPKGSAAAETNPSEPLLEALEQSSPRSLLQYLAYLDLCIVSESNVDTWRRAAFFEETGETYRRVVSVCLRPLEQLTSKLSEGLDGSSVDKSDKFSQQLRSPMDSYVDSRLHEAFSDFQLCTWCARTLSALTARSHSEDRFGVAQITGSNAIVVSTLLSCLLAVEACLGKKTNPQSPQLMSPMNIKWATVGTGRRDGAMGSGKKRGGTLHRKAYTVADVLRTSIYEIVSVFHDEMLGNVANLEKNWIVRSKPLYGSREILIQKLILFLDFRAN
ncbi:nucleoporin protein Ndc1-Nup protein [Tasmannia lanceolata]|uniref:nucleoporin protein Ndc1-Nup protein n=1 Tax=Tasmannia lanceolata TaxID=3420 RepID=UPI0040631A29